VRILLPIPTLSVSAVGHSLSFFFFFCSSKIWNENILKLQWLKVIYKLHFFAPWRWEPKLTFKKIRNNFFNVKCSKKIIGSRAFLTFLHFLYFINYCIFYFLSNNLLIVIRFIDMDMELGTWGHGCDQIENILVGLWSKKNFILKDSESRRYNYFNETLLLLLWHAGGQVLTFYICFHLSIIFVYISENWSQIIRCYPRIFLKKIFVSFFVFISDNFNLILFKSLPSSTLLPAFLLSGRTNKFLRNIHFWIVFLTKF